MGSSYTLEPIIMGLRSNNSRGVFYMKHLTIMTVTAVVFCIIINHLDASSDASMRVAALITGVLSLYHLAMAFVDTHK